MNELDEAELRDEALIVGRLLLAEEDANLSRAIYRVYLHFREHFLRESKLMDSSPNSNHPEITRQWRHAKAHAQALATYLQQCWASEIIRAHQQRNHTVADDPQTGVTAAASRGSNSLDNLSSPRKIAARDQLEEAATDYALKELRATRGDIPNALHALEQHLRDQLRHGGDAYPVAAAHAYSFAQRTNKRWATIISNKYDVLYHRG